MNEYEKLNVKHRGPLIDPCVEYSARQAIRLSSVARNGRILDYGCSVGRAAKVFHENGYDVYGVDVIQVNLEKARPFCKEIFLRTQQSIPLPFKGESFDLIFSSQVIEHLHRRDGNAFLAESYRLLKWGGGIYLTTPNPHYIRVLMKKLPMIRGNHLSSWIIEEMAASLANAGFKKAFWRGNGRMATLIGDWIPIRWIYGGYAMLAAK